MTHIEALQLAARIDHLMHSWPFPVLTGAVKDWNDVDHRTIREAREKLDEACACARQLDDGTGI